jgi:hypothetical protein
MEDLTLRYYDAEMRYLREAAKEFAQTHPTGQRCSTWIRPAHPIRMSNACLKALLLDGAAAGED